jgi:hypothetical protein
MLVAPTSHSYLFRRFRLGSCGTIQSTCGRTLQEALLLRETSKRHLLAHHETAALDSDGLSDY